MKIDSLESLYVRELRDLYSAETQLTKALPKMAEAATSKELKSAILDHLKVTEAQVERLDQIFEDLEGNPSGHMCKAMNGLIAEANEMIKEIDAGPIRDAAIITSAQRVEHYEISGYGSARAFAKVTGQKEHEKLLGDSLAEESEADQALTKLAMTSINEKAMSS